MDPLVNLVQLDRSKGEKEQYRNQGKVGAMELKGILL